MLIVEFDGPPSWSLDARGTGDSTKCLWVVAVGVRGHFRPLNLYAMNPTATTHRHIVLSPVSLASRDQESNPSNSTIGIYMYVLTEK